MYQRSKIQDVYSCTWTDGNNHILTLPPSQRKSTPWTEGKKTNKECVQAPTRWNIRKEAKEPKRTQNQRNQIGDDDSDTQASAAGDTDVDDEPDAMARRRGIPVYQSYGGYRPTVKPWREDSTADVNTIFRRVMGHKHLKTGVLEDGAICLICTIETTRWPLACGLLHDGQCYFVASSYHPRPRPWRSRTIARRNSVNRTDGIQQKLVRYQ
ncbi:hypothetical protein C8R46DRAFT_1027899 [Mycena filopes]|nr:hypothetical protein C8R46DRAFT_1027899 [Mycena filopes]